MTYTQLADAIDIKYGEIVTISSDLTAFGMKVIERGETYDSNKFLDAIIERLGDGTLLIPTYNWDFCKGKPFDYKRTKGKTGILGNAALARPDFKRTKHPIYSFAVYGKDKDYLCGLENISAFGIDSPYNYMYENHARQVGIDVAHFFTFVHYVEERINFPYRFMKYFESDYTDEFGVTSRRKYGMYVRYSGIPDHYWNFYFSDVLQAGGAREEKTINGIHVQKIDIHKSYLIMVENLNSTIKSGKRLTL